MQKKKILAGVLAAAMAMTTLAGCGAGASGSSAAAGGTAENTAVQTEAQSSGLISENFANVDTNGTKITFWHSMGGVNGEAMTYLVDKFNAENEYGITVEAVYQGSYDDAINKLKSAQIGNMGADLVQIYDIGTRFMIDSGWVIPMQVGSLYATVTLAKGLPLNPETAHLMTPAEQTSVQEKEGLWTVSEVAMYTDFTPYSTQISQLEQAGITTEDAVLVGGLPGIRMPMLLLFEDDIASYWYPMGDYGPSEAEVTDSYVHQARFQGESLHPFYDYEAVLSYAKTNQTSTQTDSSGMPNGSTSQGPTLVDFVPLLVAGAFLIVVLLVALWVLRRRKK